METEDKTGELTKKTPQVSHLHALPWNVLLFQVGRLLFSMWIRIREHFSVSGRQMRKEGELGIFVFFLTKGHRDEYKELPMGLLKCESFWIVVLLGLLFTIQVVHNFSTFLTCRTSVCPVRLKLNIPSPWELSLTFFLSHCHFSSSTVFYMYFVIFIMVIIFW